jgi:hypothetical protein
MDPGRAPVGRLPTQDEREGANEPRAVAGARGSRRSNDDCRLDLDTYVGAAGNRSNSDESDVSRSGLSGGLARPTGCNSVESSHLIDACGRA